MPNDHLTRAQILIEALPYIQKYNGKIVVIKYGGNAMISEELRSAVMSDIILLSLVGVHVVVVHGGGPEISAMLKQVGKESVFVDGLRYTDEEGVTCQAFLFFFFLLSLRSLPVPGKCSWSLSSDFFS